VTFARAKAIDASLIVIAAFASLVGCSQGTEQPMQGPPHLDHPSVDGGSDAGASDADGGNAYECITDAGGCCTPRPDTTSSEYAWLLGRLASTSPNAPAKSGGVRDYVFDAFYKLAVKPNPTKADVGVAKSEIFDHALAYQCTTASCASLCSEKTVSTCEGEFKFFTGDSVYDYNSTAFTLLALAPLVTKQASAFTSTELSTLQASVALALSALDTNGPKPEYTNVWLMRAADLVVMGEWLAGRGVTEGATYAAAGYQALAQWSAYTADAGITEFASPTYYGVDLDALVVGATCASNPSAFRPLLDAFWSDIAASFFPASGMLSGPHSRDYSFLYGAGAVDSYLYLEGWRGKSSAGNEDVFVAWNLQQGGYRPSGSACATAFTTPKTVSTIWGTSPGQDRSIYVSESFAIGSSSADYLIADQEKVVSAELPDGAAAISLVTEDDRTRDDPYGLSEIELGLFEKPYRLPSWPVTVRGGGWMLVTSYATPTAADPNSTLLTSNLLLPVTAMITRNGGALVHSGDVPLAPGDVVTAQVGGGAVSIRIFEAQDCLGQPAAPVLRFESWEDGGPVDRARIVVYHAQELGDGGTSAESCAAPFGFILAAEDCAGTCTAGAALQSVQVTNAPGVDWTVSAATPAGTLAVARHDVFFPANAVAHTIVSRTVDGGPP
jgi:hypothetical protein